MASHHITIAKASFTAACLRPDATQLTRDEVLNFHNLLDLAVSRCSSSNVQNCKNWLIDHIILSSNRTAALGKYLVSYARHVKSGNSQESSINQESVACRRILHVLYILNDVLHHVRYHNLPPSYESHLENTLQTYLPELFSLAQSKKKKRVGRRLDDLMAIWEKDKYVDRQTLTKIREGVSEDSGGTTSAPTPWNKPAKELPYIMPATHGDPTIAYYDLPAANLMPHIIPSKAIPIRSDQIRVLQLSAGPADDNLVNAVKDFLKDVNRIENPYQSLEDEGVVAGMDELGQLSYRNEADEVVGDTYYGWSRDFCRKMIRRAKEEEDGEGRRPRSSSISESSTRDRSLSRSRSRTPVKRRRYDSSRSQSPTRDYRRDRSRSGSRPKNDRPGAFRLNDMPSFSQEVFPSGTAFNHAAPMTYPPLPLGPNGLPIPPPPPPNYGGPWPPPLPAGYHSMAIPPPPHFRSGAHDPNNLNHLRKQ